MAHNIIFRNIVKETSIESIDKRTKRVKWGEHDTYPQFLWALYEESPIHGGIINAKHTYISGGGLKYSGTPEEWAIVNANNGSKCTLEEVASQIVLDNEVGGQYFVLLKKDISTKKWRIENIDFELIRPSEDGNTFFYSEDWTQSHQTLEKTGYKEYKNALLVNPLNTELTECVLWVKKKSRQRTKVDSMTSIYGGMFASPVYAGGIDAILTDIEINFFRLSEVTNGYKGGTMVNLANGIPASEDEAKKIVNKIKGDGSKREQQGGISVNFSNGKENGVEVFQLNGNDLDKRYESTEKGLLQKIMIAHGVINPKLFGVISNNALSETDLQKDYDLFQKTYAQKRQLEIADTLNYINKKFNGVTEKISFNTFQIVESQIEETTPTAVQMAKDKDPVIFHLSKVGVDLSKVKILKRRIYEDFDNDTDAEFKNEIFKKEFATLTEVQLNILRLINDGQDYQSIVQALDMKPVDVSKQLIALEKGGYIDTTKKGLTLSDKGQISIVNESDVRVVYTYELREDALPAVNGSREFCVDLIDLKRAFTRDEINEISRLVDRDVWRYRGGWYTNPRTKIARPSCRHTWFQNIIVL